ncbi:S-adenosyl-L-methionine-dependent methyltransferase [Coccomyxa subellipsoidea C-169]|uniref:16S rRNA (cytosine(967)-C(5))-methyltransferase n=1 Tax=Coccomyxa subellipsoidea (strain C-169) TaxID=574566 RepID=I0Z5M1_COCSC|nr:S-adenosyl-L-methionine-dependent methyltransferase [Coccomyxa subellipsoidea C-169]EIE25940.1 S-adenosyl-L-methionine-dependent methyltransferase [Coccomyxa subellipsoidea C-169]|eukprot:XP_005650484.1 S-adenosyl-L-methionine-dependent methyltransferase [Coccomyxa subellipsoidea C-169]
MRIDEEGAFVGLVGGSPTRTQPHARKNSPSAPLDSRDARFVTELVFGVTRWRRRLDWLISQLRPTGGALDPQLLQILRLGIFELLELRKPDWAINSHVDLAKELVRPEAARLVNGVLRNLTRMRTANAIPKPKLEPGFSQSQRADVFGIAASHPSWLVERWMQRFGEAETLKLLASNNRRPVYSLRVNTMKVDIGVLEQELQEGGVDVERSPYLPEEYLRVNSGLQEVLGQGLLKDGLCQVQDESAGMVVSLLDPQPGEHVLDACAAPGGKALFAAARMLGKGQLVANDANARRLRGLPGTAARQGLPAGFLTVGSADLREQSGQRHVPFDRVLLDAPCSGLGVLAKRADLRWRRQPADIQSNALLQDELLDAAAQLVRPGGLLVYSTCSIEPEENDLRVDAFLSRHPDFTAEPAPPGLLPDSVLDDNGFMATFPHVHGIDGAFGARLRRRQ